MGVQNLWKLLKESHCTDKNMNWNTMNGSIFAVDLSFWIVEASTAMQHIRSTDPTFRPHLRNLFFRIKHLLSLGILLIFVFDGAPPPQKFLTLQKRGVLGNINRRNNKKKYSQSVFGRQCKECKQLLDILGVPYIDLKYGEAEAFCSKLNKYGIVNAVLTPDGDSFLFGANKIFTQYQKTRPVITCCNIARSDLNQRKFIALGLLLGSDYCAGVKGIGYKTADKLLQNAMDECGINNHNDNNDELFHIIKWCKMSENEIDSLFEKDGARKKERKQSQKFIRQIRETYTDHLYLTDIVEAYLNPVFHRNDEEKLFNKSWIRWKCPNFSDMMMFCATLLQMDLKHVMRHLLDMTFDLYLFGFVDQAQRNKFEMSHIIKSRVRNKISMYSIQWKCGDENIRQQVFENEQIDLKCEGLHCSDAVQQLHPQIVQQFEEKLREKKPHKKNKKTTKKKTHSKKQCAQKTDWKKPINTNSNALIYRQNINELNDLNNLLSSISLQGSKKKSRAMSELLDVEQCDDENINNLNHKKPQKKRVIKSKNNKTKKRKRKRGNKCLLELSSDDEDDANVAGVASDNMFDTKHKKKKVTAPKSKTRKTNENKTGWKCKVCTYLNPISQNEHDGCEMCGDAKKKKKKKKKKKLWQCEACTFLNDDSDKKCKLCGDVNNEKKSNDTQSDEIWDLSDYAKKREKQKQKQKKKSAPVTAALNTSTSTMSWKCSYCKKMIPIHVYECPHCV